MVRSDAAVGRLYLRKGQIYFANLEHGPTVGSRKALVRMLSWVQGSFELEPPDESPVLEELEDSTEALLMDGMRQLDEYRVQLEKLPSLAAALTVPKPLEPKLRDLAPEELDVFQAALEVNTVGAVFDQSPLSDLLIAEKLRGLLEKGYLAAA